TQGISYKWNVSTGGIIIGSDTLSTIKVQFTTSDSTVTISLIDSVNSTGKKDTAYYAIDVYPIPLPTIKSYSIPCYESIQNYYTDWASYYTYKWDITGGTIMGEDSLEFVNVEWTSPTSGTISLTTINYIAGCMGSVSQVIYINQSPRPLINGKQSAYKGSTQQYSAQNNKDSSYEWYAINGTINGNRNLNSVNVVWGNADSGIVKLIETNFKGCVDTVSLVVNLLPVGVDELNNVNESISIFPNPATNELKISYNLNVNKNVTFTIIDILGNVVYSATEQGLAGANNSKIDLSALPQGVYYLKLTTGADAMTRIISVIR
ncbi:MAG: T9SS type A sorting domain-containing protein, partial [FCB group bacterium]